MKLCLLLITLVVTITASLAEVHMLSDDFINSINAKQSSWTAKRNFPQNTSMATLRQLASVIGLHPDPNFRFPTVYHEDVNLDDIPGSFDSRQTWPECESINTIRNQGACGSCWAFGAVEVMSDRLCIFTAGAKKFTFAPEELVSCCSACGYGCGGGYLLPPFEYWQNTGIPSGGDEGSNQGCRPYTSASTGQTPQCNERCVSGYGKDWNSDIRHGIAAFHVTNTVDQIQQEVVKNGPVEAMFQVYEDFYNYGDGVYQHTSGNFVGNHAIRIIGWGNENGQDYWLIANSWGSGWGSLGGFFKMLRGQNHCNIESEITAGIPNTNE